MTRLSPLAFLPLFFFVTIASANAAAPTKKTQKEFTAACIEGYQSSSKDAPVELGKKICECAGPESKSQGASDAALKRETARIKKDPKSPIQDQHVLDAVRYCTITALEEAHHSSSAN